MFKTLGRVAAVLAFVFPLVACGGGGSDVSGRIPAYVLGGTVSGLQTQGLVLAVNGQSLPVPAGSTSFTFPALLAAGADFVVTVAQQSSGDACKIVGGEGRMAGTLVRSVSVVCEPKTFSVAVVVSGLSGSGLQLSFAGETYPVDSRGLVFPRPQPYGAAYNIAVVAQPVPFFVHFQVPPTYRCTALAGSGIVTGDTVVSVVCQTLQTFSVEVSGLTGSGLAIGLGRGDILDISPSGAARTFVSFPEPYPLLGNYTAAIVRQPAGNTCAVVNPSGLFSPDTTILTVPVPGFLQLACSPN